MGAGFYVHSCRAGALPPPNWLDEQQRKEEVPAENHHVIARSGATWQSASPSMRSMDRPQRGRKENGLPRACGPRNDGGRLGAGASVLAVRVLQMVGGGSAARPTKLEKRTPKGVRSFRLWNYSRGSRPRTGWLRSVSQFSSSSGSAVTVSSAIMSVKFSMP